MSFGAVPDFVERKGSLFLRSDHMEYGRATLVSNWYQAREAEPVDNKKTDAQDTKFLHNSTYKRIGNYVEKSPHISTSHDQMNETLRLKEEFQPRMTKARMVTKENMNTINFDRNTGCPKGKYGDVLPRHSPNHDKRYFDTTHTVDFHPPYPYEAKVPTPIDLTTPTVWRKSRSQFTDVDDYRRHGQNTWQQEDGCYANQQERSTLVPKTDTIPQRLL